MRRTLAVLVTAAALLVPASVASANHDGVHTNASCNSKNGGNYDKTGHEPSSHCPGGGDDQVESDYDS